MAPNKFANVCGAVLDPSTAHSCAWPQCPTMIPREHFMCESHWRVLPKLSRDELWEAMPNPGEEPSPAYLDAQSRAVRWAEAMQTAARAVLASRRRPVTGRG